MTTMIEVKNKPDHIYIKPTKFLFLDDETEIGGFVAFSPDGTSTFHYPIFSDAKKKPIQYLHECILSAKSEFKTLMRKAYEQKCSVIIGQKEVLWGEYEFMFSAQTFYLGKPTKADIHEIKP